MNTGQNTIVCVAKKVRKTQHKCVIHAVRLISTFSKSSKLKLSKSIKAISRSRYHKNVSIASQYMYKYQPITSLSAIAKRDTHTLTSSATATTRASPITLQKRNAYSQSSDKLKNFGGGYLQTGHRPQGLFDPQAPPRVLVTGASGQIGTELVPYLREKYGSENIVASDVKLTTRNQALDGPFVFLDVCDYNSIARVCMEYQIDWIFHMAALLSAVGEKDPKLAIKINNMGVENTLEVARLNDLRIYIPSSIAAFGDSTPAILTPQLTIQRPRTIYGITKVYSELLGEYYHQRYGLDFRSLRYPGIISSKAMPGGGTTDYAVEIYHEAIKHSYYKCFLAEETRLPMMYMPDCIKATIMLMEADAAKLSHRVYNVTGVSFTPAEQAESIKKKIPDFKMEYVPDFRQDIAKTWPQTIDDSSAREEWKWQHDYGLDEMTDDMLNYLKTVYSGLP